MHTGNTDCAFQSPDKQHASTCTRAHRAQCVCFRASAHMHATHDPSTQPNTHTQRTLICTQTHTHTCAHARAHARPPAATPGLRPPLFPLPSLHAALGPSGPTCPCGRARAPSPLLLSRSLSPPVAQQGCMQVRQGGCWAKWLSMCELGPRANSPIGYQHLSVTDGISIYFASSYSNKASG